MSILLGGGGDPPDSLLVDAWYRNALLNSSQNAGAAQIAFFGHAISPNVWSFKKAAQWFHDRDALRDLRFDILETPNAASIDDYLSVFLMGGNTFQLLERLRHFEMVDPLRDFSSRGILYGCSAGAIVLGHSIRSAIIGDEADENKVGLSDLTGLNLLSGWNVLTHFKSTDSEETLQLVRDEGRACICIPEDSGALVTDGAIHCLGFAPISLMRESGAVEVGQGETVALDAFRG